jgi:hypothetical protein
MVGASRVYVGVRCATGVVNGISLGVARFARERLLRDLHGSRSGQNCKTNSPNMPGVNELEFPESAACGTSVLIAVSAVRFWTLAA